MGDVYVVCEDYQLTTITGCKAGVLLGHNRKCDAVIWAREHFPVITSSGAEWQRFALPDKNKTRIKANGGDFGHLAWPRAGEQSRAISGCRNGVWLCRISSHVLVTMHAPPEEDGRWYWIALSVTRTE
jgi:hypothetical protein